MQKGLWLWSLHAPLLMGLWSIAHGQARFYGLGFLPGDTASAANAVSDSALVVGYGNRWGFAWHPATGIRALEFPNAQASIAYAVSADGVVVGQAIIGLYGYACYWDETGAYRILNRPSMATGVSNDGRIIAGWGSTNRVIPFVFDRGSGRLQFLPEPMGSAGTNYIYGLSGDGRVLGGMSLMRNPYFNDPRFRGAFTARGHVWIDGTPQVRALPSGGFRSQVNALSYDGRIAVGSAQIQRDFSSPSAVLWEDANVLLLGTLGGTTSSATGTDRYGRQVVGSSQTTSGDTRAFYWTSRIGMVSLQRHFSDLVPEGWTLTLANGISPNGRFIVGVGTNPQGQTEAWLLDTGRNCYSGGDVNGDGCIDDADLSAVILAIGGQGTPEDIACDGIVDETDLMEVLFNFGNGC